EPDVLLSDGIGEPTLSRDGPKRTPGGVVVAALNSDRIAANLSDIDGHARGHSNVCCPKHSSGVSRTVINNSISHLHPFKDDREEPRPLPSRLNLSYRAHPGRAR